MGIITSEGASEGQRAMRIPRKVRKRSGRDTNTKRSENGENEKESKKESDSGAYEKRTKFRLDSTHILEIKQHCSSDPSPNPPLLPTSASPFQEEKRLVEPDPRSRRWFPLFEEL